MSTGAGVKSSVLFLRKRSQGESERIHAAKLSVQSEIATKGRLGERLSEIDKKRKAALSALDRKPEFAALAAKERKANADYKATAAEIAAEAEKATAELREELERQYDGKAGEILPDEEIFMAIAEDIGFDATGKPTKVNELDEIGVALADFIRKEATK
jgi:type I restriction enzyme M protein